MSIKLPSTWMHETYNRPSNQLHLIRNPNTAKNVAPSEKVITSMHMHTHTDTHTHTCKIHGFVPKYKYQQYMPQHGKIYIQITHFFKVLHKRKTIERNKIVMSA